MLKGHSFSLSLNRGGAYLFCMGSLTESAIAYREECALMGWRGVGWGVVKAQREKKRREEGFGCVC